MAKDSPDERTFLMLAGNELFLTRLYLRARRESDGESSEGQKVSHALQLVHKKTFRDFFFTIS